MGFPYWILGNKTEGTTVFLLSQLIFGELRTGLEQMNNGVDNFPYSQALKKTHVGLKQMSGWEDESPL